MPTLREQIHADYLGRYHQVIHEPQWPPYTLTTTDTAHVGNISGTSVMFASTPTNAMTFTAAELKV